MQHHRLVADYLRRLDDAAATLPPARRAELLDEIRTHIDESLSGTGASDEAVIRNVLERLGTPEEIVAAALADNMPAGEARARVGRLEIATLLAFTIGGVIPVLGWLVGIVLLAFSRAWSSRDKIVTVVISLAAVILLAVPMVSTGGGNDSTPQPVAVGAEVPVEEGGETGLGPLELAILLGFGFGGGVPAALYLAWRLRQERTPDIRRGGFGGPVGLRQVPDQTRPRVSP